MKLCLINNDFKYELEKLVRIFLPFEKLEFTKELCEDKHYCAAIISEDGKNAKAVLVLLGKRAEKSIEINLNAEDILKEKELKLALALYDCFKEITDYEPQWGILTGVRPAKLFSRLSTSLGEAQAEGYFKNTLKVHNKKISLCKEAVCGENKITSLSRPDSFSLYISIPFCPTRCSYCSFVSHSIESAKKLIPVYVELLCKELRATAEIACRLKLKLETVYVGGGTPTSLSAEQLGIIMACVNESFDTSNLREFTVEAGRPDTITKEKLIEIKKNGATRISINPQTMNDDVLMEIGRRHTGDDFVSAFALARELGFNNINTDLIAGLPTDTFDGFKNTITEILKLNPESVTVHSLSMKRSSTLSKDGVLPEAQAGKIASLMVDYAREKLSEKGIVPYYMYRQSKTVGNLENVGYAKKGAECLYNVYIMDETHSILACGASGVTKLREPNGSYIERIFNFKYPYEYIDRFDELILRKKGIDAFYENYCSYGII